MAQSGHPSRGQQCPLLRVKRTSHLIDAMSAFDPKQTFAVCYALPASVENGLKQAPLVGHPFEAMFSALIEGKP
jgi:hypothetical protein